jgi:hypothetical protein
METRKESEVGTDGIYPPQLDFAVKRKWTSEEQAILIRLADLIESIVSQIKELERLGHESGYDACMNYHFQTVLRDSDPSTLLLVVNEVNAILERK